MSLGWTRIVPETSGRPGWTMRLNPPRGHGQLIYACREAGIACVSVCQRRTAHLGSLTTLKGTAAELFLFTHISNRNTNRWGDGTMGPFTSRWTRPVAPVFR